MLSAFIRVAARAAAIQLEEAAAASASRRPSQQVHHVPPQATQVHAKVPRGSDRPLEPLLSKLGEPSVSRPPPLTNPPESLPPTPSPSIASPDASPSYPPTPEVQISSSIAPLVKPEEIPEQAAPPETVLDSRVEHHNPSPEPVEVEDDEVSSLTTVLKER